MNWKMQKKIIYVIVMPLKTKWNPNLWSFNISKDWIFVININVIDQYSKDKKIEFLGVEGGEVIEGHVKKFTMII